MHVIIDPDRNPSSRRSPNTQMDSVGPPATRTQSSPAAIGHATAPSVSIHVYDQPNTTTTTTIAASSIQQPPSGAIPPRSSRLAPAPLMRKQDGEDNDDDDDVFVSSSPCSASALPPTPLSSHGWTSPSSGLNANQAAFVFSTDHADALRSSSSASSMMTRSSSNTTPFSLTEDNNSEQVDQQQQQEQQSPMLTQTSPSSGSSRRRSWLTLLILPARLAVGALTFFAGARLSSAAAAATSSSAATTSPTATTAGAATATAEPVLFYTPWGWLGGMAATALSQVLISFALKRTRRRKERNTIDANKLAAQQRINWLDAIQAVGKIVDRFADGLGAPETFASVRSIFLDVSLARLVHLSTLQRHVRTARIRPTSTPDALARGRHYLDFALASYGYVLLRLTGVMHAEYDVTVEGMQGEDVARYMLGLDEFDDMVVSHLDGEEINIPRHFVALDHTYGAVVVSIRGTNSISDIITDLICSNETFATGYAHGGMKSSAEILCSSLLSTLHDLRERYPRYTLVTTGHSLGAGVAILLTKLLLDAGFSDVRCYAFAPCPVFGPLHRVDSEWSDALECFVHADDLVATLCLASARRLALEIERIDKKVDLDMKQKRTIVDRNQASVIENMLAASRSREPDPREEEVDQLFIPCHRGVHWLIRDENDDDDEDDDGDAGSNGDNHTAGGVQTSQTPISKASNSGSSSVSGLRPSNDTGQFSRTPSSSYGSTDHDNADISRQQRRNDDAVRAYNERWGRHARAKQRKKWRKMVEKLNGTVPPAYVPTAKFGSYIVRPRVFEKILVTPDCVNSHFPNMYTAAFAGLDLPERARPLPPKPKTNFTRLWYSNELG